MADGVLLLLIAHTIRDEEKQSTTVPLDANVLQWLRSKGEGYQTRLNAILREAMMQDAKLAMWFKA